MHTLLAMPLELPSENWGETNDRDLPPLLWRERVRMTLDPMSWAPRRPRPQK